MAGRGSCYLLTQEHSQMVLSSQVKFLIRRGALKDMQNIDHIDYLLVFLEEKLGVLVGGSRLFPLCLCNVPKANTSIICGK